MTRTVALAAGGTGGHLFPALALAEELRDRGMRPVLITDHRGGRYQGADSGQDIFAEVKIIPAATLSLRRPFGAVAGVIRIVRGVLAARRWLRRAGAGAVIGFGGYPSLPPMLAAGLLKLPRIIHEQNGVLGRVNRLLAKSVETIAASFDHTDSIPPARREIVRVTGNPVRVGIARLGDIPYLPPEHNGQVRLLVIGGSQGAAVLGRLVPAAIARLPVSSRARLKVTQQCREEDMASTRESYEKLGLDHELALFFADMPARLGASHLVISRAGASSVAEFAAAGRPSILIPYPGHGDKQQEANARRLSDAGAAWLMLEPGLTPEALAVQLALLLGAPADLKSAAAKALSLARPDAASALADVVEGLLGPGGGGNQTRKAA